MVWIKRIAASKPGFVTVFVAIAAIYFFTEPVQFLTTDGAVREFVAKNLLDHGEFALLQVEDGAYLNNLWTIGRNGRPYAYFGLGQSLLEIPFLVMLDLAEVIGLTSHLSAAGTLPMAGLMAISGALICALIFGIVGQLGYRAETALKVALLAAFGSVLWVLSRQSYDMVQEALGVTGALYFLVTAQRQDTQRALKLAAAGMCYGAALVVRVGAVAAAPALGWMMLASEEWGDLRERLRAAVWFAVGVALVAWVIPAYNVLRFESPFTFGYHGHFPYLGRPIIQGLLHWLISPWQGTLLYMPILLGSPLVWRRFGRRHPHMLHVIVLLFVGYLLFHAPFIGLGAFGWGPYYLLSGVLPLLILFAEFFEDRQSFPRWQRALAIALITLSVLVQVASISVPTERYQVAAVLRERQGEEDDTLCNRTPICIQAVATVQNIGHLPQYERYLDTPPDDDRETLMAELFAFNLPDWWWLFHWMKGGATGLIVPLVAGLSAVWLVTRRMS